MGYEMHKLEDNKNVENTSKKITFGKPYNKFNVNN